MDKYAVKLARSYQPIENYGIIGNMRTAALIAVDGSIDWFCFPHFDSPSVFAAILDDKKGGRFQITSTHEDVHCKQLYWPDTNVLVTRFLCHDGVGELQDFMPVGAAARRGDCTQLIRRVRMSRGQMQFRIVCEPAFDYARASHDVTLKADGAVFRAERLTLGLASPVSLERADRAV